MMQRFSWMIGVGAAMSCHAIADMPDIFDRIPADAPVVFVMPELGSIDETIRSLEIFAGQDPSFDMSEIAEMVGGIEGLDRSRAAAVYMLSVNGQFDMNEPPMIALIPVTDYEDFLGGLGVNATDGIAELEIEGEPSYAKSLGDGYALLSPFREAVESYEPVAGARAGHAARLGAMGEAAVSRSDVFVAVDVASFSDQIAQGMQALEQNLQMMAMVGGQDVGPQLEMVRMIGNRISSDGQTGFLAFDASESGLGAGVGLQFKEGSDTAGFLTGGSKASRLISRLPSKDMLLAFGADMSSPGARQINQTIAGMIFAAFPGMEMMMQDATGVGMLLGTSPGGLMGGAVFGATSAFIEVDDPATHLGTLKTSIEEMNGQMVDGQTLHTSYTPDASTAEGQSLNGWSISPELDPAMGQQAMMMMTMLFGPAGGPSGYVTTTNDGLVVTLAKNSALAGEAIVAANGGEGLGTSELVGSVSKHLPEDSMAQLYIGFGDIVEMFSLFLTMQMGPMNFEIPEDLAPIGIGMASSGGAMELRAFAPTGVLELMKDIEEAVQAAEGMGPGPAEQQTRPRF